MGKIIAGMASSHAFALSDPTRWDKSREMVRSRYKQRYGVEPPVHPQISAETQEQRQLRYKPIREGLDFLRERLKEKKPDALILIGDDQNEHFKEDNLPQIAIYLGSEVFTTERQEGARKRGPRYRCHSELANDLLNGLVECEFDIAFCKYFPQDELIAHAHGPILRTVMPEADIPVVLLFVNALHLPTISPRRCYRLGQAMQGIIERRPSRERVVICASGGLSHFTAGYPWRVYKGPYTFGSISEEFDRRVLELMARGEGDKLAGLTSQDLLENGDVEMRSWITLLGAVGKVPAQVLAYDALYSGIMGMGVAYWELENARSK